jgi:hypothetical protein
MTILLIEDSGFLRLALERILGQGRLPRDCGWSGKACFARKITDPT